MRLKKLRKLLKRLVLPAIVLSFGMGALGYFLYYENGKPLTLAPFSILYSTFKLYGFATDASRSPETPIALSHVLIEIARYIAIFVTGFAFARLLLPYITDCVVALRARRKNSMTLHGSDAIVETLREHLPDYRVIARSESMERFEARRHIIAFETDEQALRFLGEHRERFFAREPAPTIWLCLRSPRLDVTRHARIHISAMAENCARVYWDKYYLPCFGGESGRGRVLLLGFGEYAEALLDQALLVNVFLTGTRSVEYHVFGDGTDYRLRRPMLDEALSGCGADDRLVFHGADELDVLGELLPEAERIILAADDDTDNLLAFASLCRRFTLLPPIHIRLRNDAVISSLYGASDAMPGDPLYQVEYKVFGTDAELYTQDVIIRETLLERAKRVNEWYGKHYGGTSWENVGTLEQRSNIAAADHFPVKLRQMLREDCALDAQSRARYCALCDAHWEDAAFFRPYLELEHNRWMRFYYLNGWRYADVGTSPEEKKAGKARRLHSCLRDFSALDEEIQLLDMDSYRVLCEIDL